MHRITRILHPLVALVAAAPIVAAQPAIPVQAELDKLHFRSIGPATMSGRIADIAVVESNPAIWYVATAHGGLWKTENHGTTWTAMLQDQGLMSMGDVTVSQQNPNLVWAGMGESNNRQSTSWGNGVYKSTDGGATWTHMGLRDSKHIHRIAIDPSNNNIVYVAATGPLFGPGGERGVFKTTDGGATWRRVLAGDADTGANDIALTPGDPRTIYASMYARRRSECCMNGGGPGAGLFKSTDGGETWARVAGGYPTGDLGRIAVDVSRTNPNVVYSLVEAPPATSGTAPAMNPNAPVAGGQTGLYRSDDAGATWRRVSTNNPRPMYFSKVLVDPTTTERVYLGGVGLHMTTDGGATMEQDAALVTHDDIHALWVNPRNPDHLIIGNDGGVATSHDMAKSWTFIPNLPVGLFYHVSYDMETPFNICGGMQDNYNWCGPSRSRFGRGIQNYDWFQILGGDGFHAIPDQRDSRIVYTESQNGNMIRRNTVTGESKSIRPTALNVSPMPDTSDTYRFQWDAPMMLSSHDPGVLLVAGNKVFRSTDRGDSWTVISPDLTSGANRDTIRTMGVAGRDIRIATHDGISQWPAIVSLGESPADRNVLWTGTDDGVVSVTRDGGRTWRNVTANLPGFPSGAFVGEVVPSRYDAGTAYVVVPNYRQNDYRPHLWMTTDFGATFRRIDGGLAGEVTRTLTEDPRNRDVLYVGTETGLFVSLDRGAAWSRFKANLPTVRVDEISIHSRDNAMIVGSHGRAIWVLDDIGPIQELAAAKAASRTVTLFTPAPALQWKYKDDRNEEFWGHQFFTGENPPAEAVLHYYVKTAPGALMLRVTSGNTVVREITIAEARRAAGMQVVCWDMRSNPIAGGGAGPQGGGGGGGGGFGNQGAQVRPVPGTRAPLPDPGYLPMNPCGGAPGGGFGFGGGGANAGPYVSPGTYTVALVADGQVVDSKSLRVVADPQVRFTAQERAAYDRTVNEMHETHRTAAALVARMNTLRTQLTDVQAKIDTMTSATDAEKASVTELRARYNAMRARFGLGLAGAPTGPVPPQAGGGGGGGFGFQAVNRENVLARFAGLKNSVISIWETPSAGTTAQIREVRQLLDAASRDANALLSDAVRVGQGLRSRGLTLAP